MTQDQLDEDENIRASNLTRRFGEVYGRAPDGVWRAPGRVNLIGDHTDYNDGLVLPFAIGRAAMVAIRLRRAGEPERDNVDLVSTYAPIGERLSRASFTITGLTPGAVPDWGAFPAGVVHALIGSGAEIPGFELLLDSTVPVGAGLSSSHAVEVATIVALNDLLDLKLDNSAMARLTQKAENDFVGSPTGIMDQTASLMGRAGSALYLDCRTFETQAIPLPLDEHGLSLLVIDTKVTHSNAEGGYAARRADCSRGADLLGVTSLREIPDDIDLSPLEGETARRIRHVLTENARVRQTTERLLERDVVGIGELLSASHASLRDDYEVSCSELNLAVETAMDAGAIGARMTGGGFGGSAIALIEKARESDLQDMIRSRFNDERLDTPDIFEVQPSLGAQRMTTVR